MEENKDWQKKMDVILEKRRNCVQLTNEEEAFAKDAVNKLLDGKKCVRKTVASTTGEELRKGAFEGKFKSKAEIAERTDATPDPKNTPAPIRDEKISDQKEESIPSEDNSGKVKAEHLKGDNSDTDNKPFEQVNYEEDRVGRYTEHGNPKDSIKIKDVVVKSMPSGTKVLGIVVKVYEAKGGQTGLMVKWSTGQFEHVNARSVELLKGQKSGKAVKEEDAKVSPPIVEAKKGILSDVGSIAAGDLIATGIAHGAQALSNAMKPKKPKKPKADDGTEIAAAPAMKSDAPAENPVAKQKDMFPSEPPQDWIDGVIETLKSMTDLSDEEIIPMAKAAWEEVVKAQDSGDTEKGSESFNFKPGAEVKVPAGGPSDVPAENDKVKSAAKVKDAASEDDTQKGEAPPSDWMEQCKAALVREGRSVDNPFAVCTAAYQNKKFMKAEDGFVKVTPEDMDSICPPCAKSMREKKIKYYKFSF